MNILVIVGSPRVGMNTDRLCNAFIKGAESKGHSVVKFRIAGKKIGGCTHCMMCNKDGPCIQKDEMTPLYDEIDKADMIMLTSPIYFWDISSQLKAVIDRMYAPYVAGRLKNKHTAAIFVSGSKEYSNMEEAVDFYNKVIVEKLGWIDHGSLIVTGASAPGFDLEKDGHLKKAFALGANIE